MALWTRLAASAVVYATLGGCCCLPQIGETTPEEAAAAEARRVQREQLRQEAVARAPGRAQIYAKLAGSIDPTAPIARSKCDDAALLAGMRRPGAQLVRTELATVGYDALPGAAEVADRRDWAWLEHEDAALLRKAGDVSNPLREFQLEKVGDPDRRYVVVFVGRERQLPRFDKGLISDDTFVPGMWKGGLLVVDLDDGSVVCGAPFEVASSVFELADGDADGLEGMPLEDMKERFDVGANEALAGISDQLKVNLYGVF